MLPTGAAGVGVAGASGKLEVEATATSIFAICGLVGIPASTDAAYARISALLKALLTSSGIITANAKLDLNGTELILDADADTSITADTDDTIDIRLAGADDFQITANTFTILSGSTIAIAAGGGITNAGTMSSDITSTGKALVFGF